MAKKVVAFHKKTGGKYVTAIKKPRGFYLVQTARGVATKSSWLVKAKDITLS